MVNAHLVQWINGVSNWSVFETEKQASPDKWNRDNVLATTAGAHVRRVETKTENVRYCELINTEARRKDNNQAAACR